MGLEEGRLIRNTGRQGKAGMGSDRETEPMFCNASRVGREEIILWIILNY